MSTQYQAKQGDCIVTIANQFKLPWETIWNHAQNADLKRQRENPNVLYEGDQVYIPDIEPGNYSGATGAVHRLVLKREVAKLRLRIVFDPGPKAAPDTPPEPSSGDTKNIVEEDPDPDTTARPDEPRTALAYKLTIEQVAIEGETDADGYIECEIPPTAMSGQLVLAPDTPDETEITLNIGYLNPIEEVSGVKQRLQNLCFDCGDQTNEETPDLEDAVRAFQEKSGLTQTGQIDDDIRAEIVKAHIS